MLQMMNEGGDVTQAFQAVDISKYAGCIDQGGATISLSALLNTVAHPGWPSVQGDVSVYFYQSQWGWPSNVGQYTNAVNVDGSNWVQCSLAHPIPPGTRWVIFQIGFTDDTLLGRSGYADCVQMEVLTDGWQSGSGHHHDLGSGQGDVQVSRLS